MKLIKLLFIFIFLLISIAGCAEQKLLEQIGLTTLLGYDLGENEKLSTTAVIRQVNPEFQSNVEIVSAENETARGSRAQINRKTSKKIMSGQMRVVLFGEELAAEGIAHHIDTLSKNSDTSGGVIVAIVEGETNRYLNINFKKLMIL
ncbi:hypothetical protein JQK62_19035, partial [Leptospira santarosai]|nr:hypothetical protein [Leptospira santarosai]